MIHGSPLAVALVAAAVAFAWSMGAHYTGACMGMPYATGTIRLWPALLVMAPLTFLGATFASRKVELMVGQNIVDARGATILLALVITVVAFALTTAYTYVKIPTSTIQILVFSAAGAATAARLDVNWWTIAHLAILWVAAPFIACGLGYGMTRILDTIVARSALPSSSVGVLLVLVGGAASFAMGANDVSNATGVFLLTHLTGVLVAGAIGGAGLALGVLTWGKPLLERVAFDVVKLDPPMATAAQLVQALVILVAVSFGYFTSMNQALIGAMAGAGFARGRRTVQWGTMAAILRGWLIAPASGFALAYVLAAALRIASLT